MKVSPSEARARIDAHPCWYHTIDVAPGVTTPGWFDLRHAVDDLPWPDVEGKRCLDIGTFDGFYAFELERRGAREVVAVDIEDHEAWDWPPDARAGTGADRMVAFSGPPKGAGFRLLAEVRGSAVDWRSVSIYDLDPASLGTFDVVILGSLLLHLRDPMRALEAVRSVCAGELMSVEQIELWLSVVARGRPLYRLNGSGPECQWWLPNAAGHQRMLFAAGFEVVARSRPYVERFHHHPKPRFTPRSLPRRLALRAATGDGHDGVLHRGLRAVPRVAPP